MEEKKETGEETQEKPEFEKKLEEIRAENARMEKNIKELKELKALEALAGKTDAGQQIQEKPKEVDPKDYANAALKGMVN